VTAFRAASSHPANQRHAIWDNNVRWCRNYLKERGFLDKPRTGIWRITEAGRRWLVENPPPIGCPLQSISVSVPAPPVCCAEAPDHVPSERVSLDRLEETRRLMSPEQFRAFGATCTTILRPKSA